jgi:3-methyladenine DNA glycosylase AlkD
VVIARRKTPRRNPGIVTLRKIGSTEPQDIAFAPAHKQWAMNHCLAEIGIHHREHRERAIRIGEQLGVLIDYPASPGCTPPYAQIWIAEIVRRHEET